MLGALNKHQETKKMAGNATGQGKPQVEQRTEDLLHFSPLRPLWNGTALQYRYPRIY